MASEQAKDKHYLADELLLQIFSLHQLPSAATIGRERYEVINVPRGAIAQDGPVVNYDDNDLHTGACTHKHDEWKAQLRTLSAITRTNRRFRELASPILYRVYPGQTIANPKSFLRTIKAPQVSDLNAARFVKEIVIDPWDGLNTPKSAQQHVQSLGPQLALVEKLSDAAKQWNDETHVALLLFYCTNAEVLDLTGPGAFHTEGALYTLFQQLRRLGPNTLARNNEEQAAARNMPMDLPMRRVKKLFLHHAEHHYIRKLDGLEPMIRLPAVESVTVYRFWNSAATALQAFQHLEELNIWRCSFKSRDLLAALKLCAELRSLTIISAGCTSVLGRLMPEKDHPDLAKLGKVIREKHKKLRKLRLDDREIDASHPTKLGSFKTGPDLEELALNEACLGCYDSQQRTEPTVEATETATLARMPLVEMLPSSLQSLIIFRANHWWHEAERGPQAGEYARDGLVFRFDAINTKIFDLIQNGRYHMPELQSIHIDTPMAFAHDVEQFGWTCQQIVGDSKLERPSIVADSLMKPAEKRQWEATQQMRASKPSLVLRRVGL
ncbi:hypothetical protein HII31_02827 [Pseudocercospora fuligena]|uniref:Uncharacterized protein n=1 Tax=Pseudocercospora fuligena TaxID=685502 RepID=A0A8H6RPV8_9PEZI|nr:hypothetical protein HII31_02827 [Pseudocercospora fuligena]